MAKRDRAAYEAQCPGKEMFLKNARQLSESTQRRIASRRARAYGITDTKIRDRSTREIHAGIEKVHLEPDFLPASFLTDGSLKSAAVCRIRTGTGFGTGFLVGRGLIMTNNHVIKSEAAADQSVAEFDFEEGRQTRRIAITPDRFFITNPSLDYTIVGCDDQGLDDISPIRLQRNPALITEQERVVVIQHPRARKKEVALHDNRVTNLLDRVLRYRTDTEPGSSGSPVFNNAWELVALHHAGERDPDGTAENEGILISAIVNDLTEQLRANPRRNRSDIHSQLLEGTVGTSPFMGFFDTSGIFDDSSEVQVDTFTGDRDFADVGFWNIEHFNNGVSDDRIGRVADVFRRLSLDAYGLSEVQEGALDRLVEEMATHGFNLDFEVEDVTGGQDLAIVYDADTTTVEHLVVDDDGFDERVSGKRVFPRRPMFAKCSVSESDGRTAEFIMIVVHLKAFGDSLSRERRRRASRTMVRVISELRNDLDLPVVFGGDFNEKLTTNVLDSIKNAPDLLAITSDDAVSGAASFIGNSKSLIDHIVISNDVKSGIIDGDDAAIVRLDRSVAHFSDQVSDHVPLVMRIILEGESDPLTGDHDDVHSSDSATTSQTLRIPRNARHMFVKFE